MVFPTPVGVFLRRWQTGQQPGSLPHARGGVSGKSLSNYILPGSSPRPWGCFYFMRYCVSDLLVFPTPVGVFLKVARCRLSGWCLPHARGGVSQANCWKYRVIPSSPRPWGCFLITPCLTQRRRVFPTPVGVFLNPAPALAPRYRLPHARGGVSTGWTYL